MPHHVINSLKILEDFVLQRFCAIKALSSFFSANFDRNHWFHVEIRFETAKLYLFVLTEYKTSLPLLDISLIENYFIKFWESF